MTDILPTAPPQSPTSVYDLALSHGLAHWMWSDDWAVCYQKFLDKDQLPGAGDRMLVAVMEAYQDLTSEPMGQVIDHGQLLSGLSASALPHVLALVRSRLAVWPIDQEHMKPLWGSDVIRAIPPQLLLGLSDAGVSFHGSPSAMMKIFSHSEPSHTRVQKLLQELRDSPHGISIHEWLFKEIVSDCPPQFEPWRLNVLVQLDWPGIWSSPSEKTTINTVLDMCLSRPLLAEAVLSSWAAQHPQATIQCANLFAHTMFDDGVSAHAALALNSTSAIHSHLAPLLIYTDPGVVLDLAKTHPHALTDNPILKAIADRHELEKSVSPEAPATKTSLKM